MVNPKLMCRQHLLGEHVELHMLVGCIKRGFSIRGYTDAGLVDPNKINRRHAKLAVEMKRRGYNHNSRLPKFILPFPIKGEVDVKKNLKELYKRCTNCRAIQKQLGAK